MEVSEKFATWVEEIKENGDYAQESFLIDTSEVIAKEIKKSGLSKKAFAKKLGIAESYLTDILRGNRATSLQSRAKLLYKLGYEIEWKIKKKEVA